MSVNSEFFFFSHSSKDIKYVKFIVNELERANIKCWASYKSEDLKLGTIWQNGVENALENCKAGILLLTNNSKHSIECISEYSRIIDDGKKLFLLILGEKNIGCIPYRLKIWQYISFDKGWTEPLDILIRAISEDVFPTELILSNSHSKNVFSIFKHIDTLIYRIVELTLDTSFEYFSKIKDQFMKKLANFLGLGGSDLSLISVKKGSSILKLKMPAFAIQILSKSIEENSMLFSEFNVTHFHEVEVEEDHDNLLTNKINPSYLLGLPMTFSNLALLNNPHPEPTFTTLLSRFLELSWQEISTMIGSMMFDQKNVIPSLTEWNKFRSDMKNANIMHYREEDLKSNYPSLVPFFKHLKSLS